MLSKNNSKKVSKDDAPFDLEQQFILRLPPVSIDIVVAASVVTMLVLLIILIDL